MPGPALDLDQALARVIEQIPAPEGIETVRLADAQGRVTAEPIRSATDLPPFPASAMDGYAFKWHPGITALSVKGASLAGHPFTGAVPDDECVRIMTGAPLPAGCDTVVVQEDCARDEGGVSIRILESPTAGANVRAAGNDLRRGDTVVPQGRRLNPFDIGALAACGCNAARVWERPRVAVFSTGDELQQPGSALRFGNIYDSNRFAVAALLAHLPVEAENLGVLADDAPSIARALAEAGGRCRLILTSGGVSVGDADLVRSTVEALGELRFWRLNLKPGKPLAFGQVGNALLLGLPGNPVSTIVTFLLIAKPAIEKLCGTQPSQPVAVRAELTEPIAHKPGREEYQRGMATIAPGKCQVRTTGDQGSNRMSTFTDANCLIRIPKRCGNLSPGSRVEVLLFEGLL